MPPGAEIRQAQGYREGDEERVQEVEAWIRRELTIRYPMLRDDHGDLCQSVHEKLLRNLQEGRFRPLSTFRTYVARITHYTAIDLIRKRFQGTGVVAPRQDDPSNPYRTLEREERWKLLVRALLLSSNSCIELWRLVLVDQLPYEQVAVRLQIPVGTVKSRMWYCRKRLLSTMERLEQGKIR